MKHRNLMFKTVLHLCKRYVIYVIFSCFVVIGINWDILKTEDWVTYRNDNARSGVTTEHLTPPLSLRWTFKPTHAPKPAWPEPGEEMARMHFDNAHHVTSAKGMVYFGSPVDNKVYAINAKSGKINWTFFTEGPVRYPPTIWKDHIYAGSDDGYVYCLRANNGRLIWKYRAGPSDEKVLGNGRMISLWPVRTSVLVDDGIVYFGAGVFPYEGIYICALNADDGTIIWKNDTIGDHDYELAYGGISPQSFLVASKNVLYVPSGRAMPAAFDKKSGQFLYYCLPGAKRGGTWALLNNDNNLIAGVDFSGTPTKVAYDEKTGKTIDDMHAWFPGIDLVVTSEVSYTLTENGIYALGREDYSKIRSGRLNEIRKERQRLSSLRSDLRGKRATTKGEVLKKLYEKIADVEKKIEGLSEKENRLKPSICRWEYLNKNLYALILTGNNLFAGGNGIVVAVDAETGKELWNAEVDGKVRGLAATNGNLFISTGNGKIYCFGEGRISKAKEIKPTIDPSPYRRDKMTKIYASAVRAISSETGIKKGYCLVFGSGTGRLAFELARHTELKIIGIEENPKKVEEAKKRLDAAGLYGSRVVVEQWDLSSLPDYFANLIVSNEVMISGRIKGSSKEMYRVLRPFGGVAYFGQTVEASNIMRPLEFENLLRWLRFSGAPETEITKENGLWAKVTRGELEGAGSWTQQFANPQNTACSGDQLVKSPLGVLWFGEPGSKKIVDRHAKATSPVSMDGRLFIQGNEIIMAYDAYNGTLLWEREIPGAVRARADRDCGNLALTEGGLYLAAKDKCYFLDPATGETVRVYELPSTYDGSSRRWGYISFTDNILYGSRALPFKREYAELLKLLVDNGKWRNYNEIPSDLRDEYETYKSRYPVPDDRLKADFRRSGALWNRMTDFPRGGEYYLEGAATDKVLTSDMVFALDPETGKVLWSYKGDRIAHSTISIGDNKIFFAESAVTEEQKRQARKYRKELIRKGVYKEGEEADVKDSDIDVRLVVALSAATGKNLWEKPIDLTGCCGDHMGTIYHKSVLLFSGNFGNHDAWRFSNGSLRWRRTTALSTENGEIIWSKPLNYRTRPLIVGDELIIEPRACDFRTGEIKMRSHPITGEQVPWEFLRPGHCCAVTSASADMLFYRSSHTGIYDLAEDRGVSHFGGIRPDCLINLIPASGLLLFPEGSSGCTCSYPLRCSIAFTHKKKRHQPWSVFITHGAMTPVKHFAINLGAPADMKDEEGTVWFGYPNPKTVSIKNHFPNYGVKFDLHDKIIQGMGYFCTDVRSTTIEGTDEPWLFASGCLGLSICEVPLIYDAWGEKPGVYTVRLGFNAPSGDRAGQRVFDVILQDNIVLKNFEIIREASARNIAVIKEFNGIKVENVLKVELSSKRTNPTIGEAPIINFIEVIREDDAEISEFVKPVKPIMMSNAEALLRTAKSELRNRNYERALEKYHTVLDAAPSDSLKQQALNGMAVIGSPKSLRRIARYCRDDSPILIEESRRGVLRPNAKNSILWDYKDPNQELINSATKVYVAIANNAVKSDKQKAIKMLKQALEIANKDIRKQVVVNLRNLGIEVNND